MGNLKGGKPPRGFEAALLGLAAVALSVQLFVPPIVGLANNGDFSRVAEPLGIFVPEEVGAAAFFDWIVPQYRFDSKRIWLRGLFRYSSETLLGVLALPVGSLISAPGRFRLEAIGVVNGLALLAAIWVLLLALRPLHPALRVLGGLLVLVIFTDVAYVAFFNSFYTEPSVLVFFLAAVGLALLLAQRADPSGWMLAGFFATAGLLATSRPQNALLGLLFAFLGIRLLRHARGRSRRRFAAAAAIAVGLLPLWYSRQMPRPLRQVYLYNAVFRELLSNSADPRGDLIALGLAPELDRFIGTSGFSPAAPIAEAGFQKNFFGRVSYGRLARFYAVRPTRLWIALERSASRAFKMRPLNLGNYARTSGRPAGSRSRNFAAWSRAKEELVPARLWFLIAYLLINLVVALAVCLRGRKAAVRLSGEIWIAVVLVAAFQFAVSAVMDAESRRSLFLFNTASDLQFAALCLLGASRLIALRGWASDRTPRPGSRSDLSLSVNA